MLHVLFTKIKSKSNNDDHVLRFDCSRCCGMLKVKNKTVTLACFNMREKVQGVQIAFWTGRYVENVV